jgi:hypothetical protein
MDAKLVCQTVGVALTTDPKETKQKMMSPQKLQKYSEKIKIRQAQHSMLVAPMVSSCAYYSKEIRKKLLCPIM